MFAVQDEIVVAVTIAIQPAVAEAEQRRALRRPPEILGAWERISGGCWHLGKCNPMDNKRAQEFFHRAVALDETLERAPAALAVSLFLEGASGTQPLLDAATSARDWAQRACEADPSDADAQAILALSSLLLDGDFDAALDRIAIALASNHNSFWANASEGTVLTFSGHPKEGRAALLRAERLNPHDPSGAFFPNVVVISHYFERDYAEAETRARRAISQFSENPMPYRWLAAALGQLGQIDEASGAERRSRSPYRPLPHSCIASRPGCGRSTTTRCWRAYAKPAGRADALPAGVSAASHHGGRLMTRIVTTICRLLFVGLLVVGMHDL